MQTISQKNTLQLFESIKRELFLQFPLTEWTIKPGDFLWTKHKTKYGMARFNGDIFINRAFISSTAWQLLDATIRHELAHLYIGLAAGHNADFQATAQLFKSCFKSVPRAEIKQFQEQISYRYKLYAICENGDSILLKKTHRKHAKYTQYKARFFYKLSINGQKIKRFNYIDIC